MNEPIPAVPVTPAIVLNGLSKNFGPTRALDGIDLTVRRGEVFGYLGSNGAGKTTTIKILCGLLAPDAGDAQVCGHSVLANPMAVKATIGYVPESGALFEKLSPREYLTMVGKLYGLTDDVIEIDMDRWLLYFGLRDRRDQRMDGFSKGTKQKICWIAAVLHDPAVLILDEPLNGLDVEAVTLAKDLMREMAVQGRTVFYSSHLVDVVEKVCSRVAVLNHGRLLRVGTPAELIAETRTDTLEYALKTLWRE